jgi:hypothetical protein
MQLTAEQLRARGLEALRRALGRAGMIRFLRQLDKAGGKGSGNYTRERQQWVEQTSLEQIMRQAKRAPTRRRRAAKRTS